MLLTERQVRDNLRNRQGKRVFFLGPKDQLTSEARDFLQRERVEIRPAKDAPIDRYRLLNGGWMAEKPEHMTHLYGDVLVEKTHPRIRFRGKMDSLQSILLLAQVYCPAEKEKIQEILDLSGRILRADVLEEPLEEKPLCGFSEEEIHSRSHFPQDYYGIPHFMPRAEDGTAVLWLNRCRSAVREAELSAARAFETAEGGCERGDILKALNRMSSMAYILMIEKKAGSV